MWSSSDKGEVRLINMWEAIWAQFWLLLQINSFSNSQVVLKSNFLNSSLNFGSSIGTQTSFTVSHFFASTGCFSLNK